MRSGTTVAVLTSLISTTAGATATPSQLEKDAYKEYAPAGSYLAHVEQLHHNGSQYTLLKYIEAASDRMIDVNLNQKGELVESLPDGKQEPVIEPKALDVISNFIQSSFPLGADSLLPLEIGLKIDWDPRETAGSTGQVLLDDEGQKFVYLDGDSAGEDAVADFNETANQLRLQEVADRVEEVLATRERVFSRLGIFEDNVRSPTRAGDILGTLQVELDTEQLGLLLSDTSDIVHVRIPPEPVDDIGAAMAETRVDPYALSRSNHSGTDVGIYMTESGCPEATWIDSYTRLSGSTQTDHSRRTSAIMRAVSPDAWIYCGIGVVLPSLNDLGGTGGNAPIHIINRSNSETSNGDYDWTARSWDLYSYSTDVAIFSSAGNRPGGSNWVRSPGLGSNMATVGSYEDQSDNVSAFSSFQGPETDSLKPEFVAPGEGISVAGFGPASGTSYSTPHAAAMAANYLEAVPVLKLQAPAVRAAMMAGARRTVNGSADRVGLGGVDYKEFITGARTFFWNGSNSYFESQDSDDGNDDGWITRYSYLNSSSYETREILTWQNDGDHVFSNRSAAQPLSANYDVRVYDPNGNFIGCGCSLSDQYEEVFFDPIVSGNYRFEIRRTSNNDSNAKTDLGLSINWL